MSRRTVIMIVVGAVVAAGAAAAIAGPLVYGASLSGAAAPVPTLTAAATHGPAIAVGQVDGTWRVAAGSYAGYRVEETLNGATGTVVGRTGNVDGDLTVTDGRVSAASVTVNVASITTDDGGRDSYFTGTAMKAFRYPTATFTLTAPITAGAALREGVPQTVLAHGELTLAGMTRPVQARLDAVFDGAGAQVAGTIPVTFADFGIQAPTLGFVTVEKTGSVEVSLRLVRG